MKINLPHNYKPRDYQIPFLRAMNRGLRRACLVWHRRSGKDKTALNFTINEMFKRVGSYYYFFPTLKQARKALWDGMDFDGFKFMNHFPKELVTRKREDEMKIDVANGSIFQLCGSDNFDAVMGTNPVGMILSEYSLQDPRAWDFFRPILRENKGWAIFLYTPRGKNHGYHIFEKAKQLPETWYTELLTVDDTFRHNGTPVLTPDDIEQERKEGMDEDMILQEYYCSFTGGMAGQIYGRQMSEARADNRVGDFFYDPNLPVYTYWDVGYRDATAIWFVQFPDNFHINLIRYFEHEGEDVKFYIKKLEDWRYSEKYIYADHYVPHDADSSTFGSAKSPAEQAYELGYRFTVIERTRNKQHGIQNVRAMLPKCRFHLPDCNLGIDALENYHKQWDPVYKRYSDQPVKNWAVHGADAFRTMAEAGALHSGPKMTPEQARAIHEEAMGRSTPGPLEDDFFDEDYYEF